MLSNYKAELHKLATHYCALGEYLLKEICDHIVCGFHSESIKKCLLAELDNTMQYNILEGENFGETVHAKNWQIILWRMPKIAKAPKIIIMRQTFTG